MPDWAKYYKYQILLANKLLEKYSASSIVKALSDYRNKKTYSFKSPILLKVIKEYSSKENNVDFTQTKIELEEHTKCTGRNNNNTGLWDKLNG